MEIIPLIDVGAKLMRECNCRFSSSGFVTQRHCLTHRLDVSNQFLIIFYLILLKSFHFAGLKYIFKSKEEIINN